MATDDSNSHTDESRIAQQQALHGSDLKPRFVEVDGAPVQVFEQGHGQPVLVLHGTGAGAAFLHPLLDRLDGVRVLAPDRPGQGLSDPIGIARADIRCRAEAWIDHLLDAVACDPVTIVGHSMGGLWALWYALAYPRRVTRLVLLAPPQLPGTRCPLPYRVMGTPGLFGMVQRVAPPSRMSSQRFAKMMGEGDTITGHPDLLDLMVAAANDQVTARTNVNEARAIISPLALVTPTGFRRSTRIRTDELRRLSMPVLVVWGDREPLGPVSVAKDVVRRIPTARLAVVPAGHAPWIGQPDLTAELVNRFVHDDATSTMGDSTQWRTDIEMGIAPDAAGTASSVPSTSNRTRGDAS